MKEINKNKEWIKKIVQELTHPTTCHLPHQILDIYECVYTGCFKAKIRSNNGKIVSKKIGDIVSNLRLLERFNTKTIRSLTYLAALEDTKPDYSVVAQRIDEETDDYLLGIKTRNRGKFETKSLQEISKDQSLLSQFHPFDTHKIGYLAGVRETVREFNLKYKTTQELIENLPVPGSIYWKNKEGIYLGCNDYMIETAGLNSKDDIIGKSDIQLWPEQAPELRKTDTKVMDLGQAIQLEENVTLPNGKTKYFFVEKMPLRDLHGDIIGIVGNSLEITAFKQASSF